MPLQLLNVISSISITTAVIFEEKKNINNHYQAEKQSQTENTAYPPELNWPTGEKMVPGIRQARRPLGGRGGSHPPCRVVTSRPPWGEPAIRVTPSRSDCSGHQMGPRKGSGQKKRKPHRACVLTLWGWSRVEGRARAIPTGHPSRLHHRHTHACRHTCRVQPCRNVYTTRIPSHTGVHSGTHVHVIHTYTHGHSPHICACTTHLGHSGADPPCTHTCIHMMHTDAPPHMCVHGTHTGYHPETPAPGPCPGPAPW